MYLILFIIDDLLDAKITQLIIEGYFTKNSLELIDCWKRVPRDTKVFKRLSIIIQDEIQKGGMDLTIVKKD